MREGDKRQYARLLRDLRNELKAIAKLAPRYDGEVGETPPPPPPPQWNKVNSRVQAESNQADREAWTGNGGE
eukprot:608825-Prorocentrum_minimum.AAC.1